MKKGSVFLSDKEYKNKLFSLHAHGFDYKKFSEEWERARINLKKPSTNKSDKVVKTISGCRFKAVKNIE